MTVDELLALAGRLPPNVRRLEFEERGAGDIFGRIAIETTSDAVPLPPAPAERPKKLPPSDVSSLGNLPNFSDD